MSTLTSNSNAPINHPPISTPEAATTSNNANLGANSGPEDIASRVQLGQHHYDPAIIVDIEKACSETGPPNNNFKSDANIYSSIPIRVVATKATFRMGEPIVDGETRVRNDSANLVSSKTSIDTTDAKTYSNALNNCSFRNERGITNVRNRPQGVNEEVDDDNLSILGVDESVGNF